MQNLSRIIALALVGSAAFVSVNIVRLRADFRTFMPEAPQAEPGTTSFIAADPEGIWVGTAEVKGHSAVRRTLYGSIGSVTDTRNRILIFSQDGAVLADVGAHSQDPVLVNYIRRQVQETRKAAPL
jgi:hypothetical protein